MIRIYMVLIFFILSSIEARDSYIMLSQSINEEVISEDKSKYDSIIKEQKSKGYIDNDISLVCKIKKIKKVYTLRVGPFQNSDNLAIAYYTLKPSFVRAFIIEEIEDSSSISTNIFKKPATNTIHIDNSKNIESDETLWVALFGLAIIGILFMFLSSDQIRRIKLEHKKMRSKYENLESKQNEVLSDMGENIHSMAKKAMIDTSKLVEKAKETPLEMEVEKVAKNENELIDISEDLIKFLRLKSKKVIIQNEIFDFNHVLNEVTGLLHSSHKQNDMEIIFDIDKSIPRLMLADSLHLSQIIINVLDYLIKNSVTKCIGMRITSTSSMTDGMKLKFVMSADFTIDDKDTLFDSYYDEEKGRYVGLGLFVAKELAMLMEGDIFLSDLDSNLSSIVLSVPIENRDKDKRKYRLKDKSLESRNILIVDKNIAAIKSTEKLFDYFNAKITTMTVDEYMYSIPNFSFYDMVLLHNSLFDARILEILSSVKSENSLRVVSLENLFSSKAVISSSIIDAELIKPLTQEYVYETLNELKEGHKAKSNTIVEPLVVEEKIITSSLAIHREPFPVAKNINLESFMIFEGASMLLVEDNAVNQRVVLSILGKSGMKLIAVSNGEEALKYLAANGAVDFIFMDINMPVMDGFIATQHIRENKEYDNMAIVSLTALVAQHEINKMFDCGMNGYISKPVHIERLYSALHTFLSVDSKDIEPAAISGKPEKIIYEGLDINIGLHFMRGNEILHKEVLSEFVDAYSTSGTILEKLVKEHRFEQVKMLCIDMGGLTGSIGAKEMHEVINDIRQLLLYNKQDLVYTHIDRYKSRLDTLCKSIDKFLLA